MSGQNECGVGSAPKSRFAVVTDLDVVSDADTAEVLAHDSNAIDIYILTAGATDNGRTIQSVRRMTDQALMNGVNTGRKNGKGSIFVWGMLFLRLKKLLFLTILRFGSCWKWRQRRRRLQF